MKIKKIQKKITLGKQTIAALNDVEMVKPRGGLLETRLVQCSVETFCRTECVLSMCLPCY